MDISFSKMELYWKKSFYCFIVIILPAYTAGQILSVPSTLSGCSNSDITLAWEIDRVGDITSIKWLKGADKMVEWDGTTVTVESGYTSKVEHVQDGTIKLKGVTTADNSNYECQVLYNLGTGTDDASSVSVTILVAPDIPTVTNATTGGDTTFTCAASTLGTPATTLGIKIDGGSIEVSASAVNNDGKSVSCCLTGTAATCMPSNSAGTNPYCVDLVEAIPTTTATPPTPDKKDNIVVIVVVVVGGGGGGGGGCACLVCHVFFLVVVTIEGAKKVNKGDKHVLIVCFKDKRFHRVRLPLHIHWKCKGIVILEQKVNESQETTLLHRSGSTGLSGYTPDYTYDEDSKVHTVALTIASVHSEHAGKWKIDIISTKSILQWRKTHTLEVSEDDKTGPNTGAGNTTAPAVWKKNNSILPFCTGGDAAGPRSAGDGSSVTTGHREGARKPADTKERNPDRAPKKAKKKKRRLPPIEDAGSAVSRQDIELNPLSENKSSGRPLPLPQNTRGLSANFDEAEQFSPQTTGRKLPPIEPSIIEVDEKKKKKKKRRSKEDENDE